MSSKYDPAIDKGIALLDAKVPEWCTKMQLDHLHMGSAVSCVLGQVFNSYAAGSEELAIWDEESQYGFELPRDERWPEGTYANLTRRWKQRIRQHCERHS